MSVDDVSSGVHELLILNSRYSANCESGNLLKRKCALLSGARKFVMVEVDYGDKS